MFDIFGRKEIKKQQEYIEYLEIKLIKTSKALDETKAAYNDLEKKYKKIKEEKKDEK